MKNQWCSVATERKGQTLYIFTDAAGFDGWGFCVANEEGECILAPSFKWREDEKELHIFVKETWATCWTAKFAARKFKDFNLIFVGDNAPSLQAISRGYSANRIARAAIIAMLTRLSGLSTSFKKDSRAFESSR